VANANDPGVLHTDDIGREGNLTAADYEAARSRRMAEGPVHQIPADVLAAAEAAADAEANL